MAEYFTYETLNTPSIRSDKPAGIEDLWTAEVTRVSHDEMQVGDELCARRKTESLHQDP